MSPALATCPRPSRRPVAVVAAACAFLASSCWSPSAMRQEADDQVYGILDHVTASVTGTEKHYRIGRREDTLRRRTEREYAEMRAQGIEPPPIRMNLVEALEIAAENSREFQRQKESLYRVGLNLTRTQFDFSLQWFGGSSEGVDGVSDDSASATISNDLSASINTTAGTRVVSSFVNTFFRDLVRSDNWNGSSVLNLSITQPLLRASRRRIVREPLTQSERDVVYAVRSFERFRETLAVNVVSDYLRVLQRQQNLESVRNNLESVQKQEALTQALFDNHRRAITDLDRASQSVLQAENNLANSINALQQSLDSFKLTLGLTVDTPIELDPAVFDIIEELGILPVDLTMDEAIDLALQRRYDYRTICDQVDDAARQLLIAEDGLRSFLDLSAAVQIPTDPGQPLDFDFSQIAWSAGFDLDLALAILPQRNVYRSQLISLDNAIRTREEFEDQVKFQIRNELRDISNLIRNYEIAKKGVELNARRVDSTTKLYEFGRAPALDVLDAQNDLLGAELNLTAAVVDYAIARLQLLRDLEAIRLDEKGLTIELDAPLPTGPQNTEDTQRFLLRRQTPRSWETDQPWQELLQDFAGTESKPEGS